MKFILLIIFSLFQVIYMWNLTSIGLNKNYRLQHVSLFYIRAFLSIETDTNELPTLIESTWPENFFVIKPKPFPNWRSHGHKIHGRDCNRIYQVKITEIDDLNRLWIFDTGNKFCKPKILIYDLLRMNREIFRTDFDGPNNEIISMKIDSQTKSQNNYDVYFTMANLTFIRIFNLNDQTWRSLDVTIRQTNGVGVPFVQFLYPREILFTASPKIYITDKSGTLYSADIRSSNITELQLQTLGTLLGPTNAIVIDPWGMIYYTVPKYGIVVRWQPTKELIAEKQEILYFSGSSIVQIVFGAGGSVWVVKEFLEKSTDHCDRILFYFAMQPNSTDILS